MNTEENIVDLIKRVEENATTDEVIRYAHKVTIDNLSDYIEDDFWSDALFEGETYITQQFASYLQLGVNKIDKTHNGNFVVFVNFQLFENIASKVEYKLSILDGDGKCRFEKVKCTEVNEVGKYVWKFDVDFECIRSDDKVVKIDEVVVCCENKITRQKYERLNFQNKEIENENIRVKEDILNAKPRVIESLAHKWTIDNFGSFYRDEWKIDCIESNIFHSNSNKEHQFHLLLFPNGDRDEYRNNLALYLFYFSPDSVDANIRCKISIIDEKEEKSNAKCFQYLYSGQVGGIGFAEYMSVSNLNELMHSDQIILLCEVQVIGDGDEEIEDNRTKITEVSESYSNGKLQVIDSLFHKWTFDNFGSFYQDEWTIDFIESNKFHSSTNKEQQFHLCIFQNGLGDEHRNYLSIYLLYSSPDHNVDVKVRCRVSIIDENGEKFNTKSLECIFNARNNQGIGKYISISELLDHSNGLLSDDTLTLLCEIQMFDSKMKHSTTKFDPIASPLSLLQLNQLYNSVHLSKCAHRWTIHNFACALADESNGDELISCRFTSSKSKDFLFYIRIFPKGCDKESRNYVSVRLYGYLYKRMKLTFRYKISLIDPKGNMLKLRGEELSIDRSSYVILTELISHGDLHQHLNDGALRLYCEIGAIENYAKTELSRTEKEKYFSYLSKLTSSKNEVLETVTNAKAKKIQFEYVWVIENCEAEASSLFTSHPTSSYIESPSFSPPNHSTTNQHRFYLRMYPNGMNEENKNYVSMHFGFQTFEKRQVTYEWKVSLIDCFGCKFNTQEVKERHNDNKIRGWLNYISHFDLFNQTNALITDNKLRVHCEIEFLDEEEFQENKITIEETNEDSKPANISIMKSHSALSPTQSITQVTLITHHWTINNFGLYFQSIQDKSSYLESAQFSPASDNQLKLILRLYPKISTDQLTIYYAMMCNRKQMPLGRVHISVLDEDDRKCYTKSYRIQNGNVWQCFAELNWKDIRLEPNCINQLKLLFQLCAHYSSNTEMSHLDQFTIDQFTSPWQVKRLCHVPTHSRALTSIPVESCHFEWSIHDFSGQMESEKQFNLGQLEFSLKMYSQPQGKILIYLCLKKSVEKDVKMCMKILILDKDGHKTDTKDVIKKLTNVELEYECAELEINEHVIQEDGQLKMFCEINLLEEPSCSSVFVQQIPKVLLNLNQLLTNRQKSDVVLQFLNGNQLHAHRSILSSRSPVFEKMFEHDTSEAQHGQVDITDIDMEVCELMLRYIYTGLVEHDQAWTLDLMIAADKYQISELKTQCEDWLCTNLSIESVTDCLVWSDQIGATKLKTKSIAFFHRNSILISQTNAIKEIIKNCPDLMQELYLDLTRKFLNNKPETNLIEEEEDEDEDICVL